MACYHPLKGFKIGINEKTGKPQYKIVPYTTDHIELNSNGVWQPMFDSWLSDGARDWKQEFVQIPCGQCIGCRLDYSREWANRCVMELGYHKESWFITLTYDNDHVPWSDEFVNPETGELLRHQTLVKKDFQDFMKRLRRNYEYKYPDSDPLRFYACGEYGSTSFRPHFHAIIYGLHLDDLVIYGKNEQGDILYNSQFISDCWHNKGFAVIGQVTWESCAYVARYIMKKLKGDQAKFYEENHIVPEFTLMSRRPGIARQYYDDHPNMYEFDFLNLSTPSGGKKIKHPRYFDRLYDIEYPEEMKIIKDKRKSIADSIQFDKLLHCSYNYLEMLSVEEEHKKAQIKALQRR